MICEFCDGYGAIQMPARDIYNGFPTVEECAACGGTGEISDDDFFRLDSMLGEDDSDDRWEASGDR